MPTVKTLLPKVKAKEKKVRVAAYCRVSSNSLDQINSFNSQVNYYTNLIESKPEMELVEIYADEGLTGVTLKKRDNFNRLIDDCRKGKIDRVITKSVSRFARNMLDFMQSLRELTTLGVTILYEKEQIDTATMPGEMIISICAAQAQFESMSISTNMRWSYDKRIRSGNFITNYAPFGYNLVDNNLEINQEENKTVQKIFEMYLSGISTNRIADYLNQNNVPYRNNRKWQHNTINYILKNEKYIGDSLLQKKFTTKEFPFVRKRNNGERSKFYVESSHSPEISKTNFENVQDIYKQKHISFKNRGNHQLSKLLRCSDCGHNYRRVNNSNKPYWKCSSRASGWTDCSPFRIYEEDVKNALIRMVNTLRNGEIIKSLIKNLELLQDRENGTKNRVYEVDVEIANINNQLKVLANLQSSGIIDAADFAQQKNELSNKLTDLRRARHDLINNNTDDNIVKLYNVSEILDSIDSDITDLDEQLIRSIVEKIVIKSNKELEIHIFGSFIVTENLPERRRN